jgi:hypothetical protein
LAHLKHLSLSSAAYKFNRSGLFPTNVRPMQKLPHINTLKRPEGLRQFGALRPAWGCWVPFVKCLPHFAFAAAAHLGLFGVHGA